MTVNLSLVVYSSTEKNSISKKVVLMIDLPKLALFIPTFFLVSVTPGMCMSLAMTLGMRVGYRRTLYMMAGEMLGVAIVCICVMYGVSIFLLNNPMIFIAFKILGGCYLIYLGIQLYLSQPEVNELISQRVYTASQLFTQGFVTAFSNPKGWAFMVSLLPPFISREYPFGPQLTILITIILVSEFIAMSLYAFGGKKLYILLNKSDRSHWLNKIAGGLLCIVGIWLFAS